MSHTLCSDTCSDTLKGGGRKGLRGGTVGPSSGRAGGPPRWKFRSTHLRLEVEGRNRRGVGPTFAEGGKAMTPERDVTLARVAFVVALHARVVEYVGSREQEPAVAAVVALADQHAHAAHEGVRAPAAEQQQPPRHTFVPQSKEVAHDSPGE